MRKKQKFGLMISERVILATCVFLLNFLFVFGWVYCPVVFSQDDQVTTECVSCHNEVYQKGTANAYVHPPFERRQCPKCHLKDDVVVLSSQRYRREHTFLISELDPRGTYNIDIAFQDLAGNLLTETFKQVVPIRIHGIHLDDKKPPKIFNIKVGPIIKGAFWRLL